MTTNSSSSRSAPAPPAHRCSPSAIRGYCAKVAPRVAVVGYGPVGILFRALVCLIRLLPPSVLMGATLPAISRWLETTGGGTSRMGLFYTAIPPRGSKRIRRWKRPWPRSRSRGFSDSWRRTWAGREIWRMARGCADQSGAKPTPAVFGRAVDQSGARAGGLSRDRSVSPLSR
jgi:hypothetical protein